MLKLNTKFLRSLLLVLVMYAGIVSIVPAHAVTLKQATQQVKQQSGGKIVSATTTESNGRRIHVIRYVTKDGVVRTAEIPE